MPRLTLQSKAFLALTLLLAVLLLLFVGFSRLGLQRGLGPYVAEIELARMDWLAARLQRMHLLHGGWQTLRTQPELWREMRRPGDSPALRSSAQGAASPNGRSGDNTTAGNEGRSGGFRERPPPPPDFGEPGEGPPPDGYSPDRTASDGRDRPPPPPGSMLSQRLGVLDAQGRLVAGVRPTPDAARLPLRGSDGTPIGELVLSPPSHMETEADRAFIARQLGFVVWTGIAGLALALLLSWALARRWLAPIGALVDGARGVAAGRLDTRVAVHGDDELARLALTFNDMAEQLGGMEASRRQWIGDVAHELRTPLAAMRAEIEAVQDGVRPFDDKTALRLHRQVMRLIQLVGDLRASLDAAAGSAPSALVPVHPLSLLAEAVASMQPRFDQADLALDTHGLAALARLPPPPLVRGDAQQLHRVFLNLLENTVRYTDPGGRLEIQAQTERSGPAPSLVLQFDDTAPGVAEHDLPRLFDRLYRAEASRARATGDLGGSGLGLAICRAIVQSHGGRITAQPSPLGGLRTTLTLPLLENPS
ncbi:HAMP domain-containing protein [Acidovorax sp. SUPP2522]|uniref:ATP-binding protein n=1 Tax=unclassified Acidovorax TaxID=2684926 RepID=UPI0023495554|nr:MULTISPECIES: ATP-binding protein [unclassified Acidovorax]WCM96031.1 ATP-binding protein [Acidovorax sp. GBBC 1281]GKT18752.1 HAMP domain-containing protein [Acidovorax sp. SUPP2522]